MLLQERQAGLSNVQKSETVTVYYNSIQEHFKKNTENILTPVKRVVFPHVPSITRIQMEQE